MARRTRCFEGEENVRYFFHKLEIRDDFVYWYIGILVYWLLGNLEITTLRYQYTNRPITDPKGRLMIPSPLLDYVLLQKVFFPLALFVSALVDPFDKLENLRQQKRIGIAGDLPHLLPLGVEDHQIGGHFDLEDHLKRLSGGGLAEDHIALRLVSGDAVDIKLLGYLVKKLYLLQLFFQPFTIGAALRVKNQHHWPTGSLDLFATLTIDSA